MALKDPGSFEWKAVFAVTGTIDLVQWIIDFTGVGNVINEVIDTPIGIVFAVYLQVRGVSMTKRISRLISLVLGDVAEELTDSAAPAWIIDAWYIHKTVIEEWAQEQTSSAEAQEDRESQPLNQAGIRKPPVIQKPLNQGGKRLPNGGI